jgi:hypothetical protein
MYDIVQYGRVGIECKSEQYGRVEIECKIMYSMEE